MNHDTFNNRLLPPQADELQWSTALRHPGLIVGAVRPVDRLIGWRREMAAWFGSNFQSDAQLLEIGIMENGVSDLESKIGCSFKGSVHHVI